MQTTLVILAAGMGSRYGGLKQLDEVGPNGEIIMDFSIHDALAAGFSRFVFIIRESFSDAFRDRMSSRFPNLDAHYVFQELNDLPAGFSPPEDREKPWGTGHALWVSRDSLTGPFAIINADDYYGPASYKELHRSLTQPNASACIVSYVLENTLSGHGSVSRGVCATHEDHTLADICERTDIARQDDGRILDSTQTILDPQSPVSMNMWGFSPRFLDALETELITFLTEHGQEPKAEFYLPAAVDNQVKAGQLTVDLLQSPDTWLGVTYPEDKATVMTALQALVDSGLYS